MKGRRAVDRRGPWQRQHDARRRQREWARKGADAGIAKWRARVGVVTARSVRLAAAAAASIHG